MTHIWSPLNKFDGSGPNMERCRESVYIPGAWRSKQCTRKAIAFRCTDEKGKPINPQNPEEEFGFCRQHDPVNVAAKEAERQARWEAERRVRDAHYERQKQIDQADLGARAALAMIANGTGGDPRLLALTALQAYPDDLRERIIQGVEVAQEVVDSALSSG